MINAALSTEWRLRGAVWTMVCCVHTWWGAVLKRHNTHTHTHTHTGKGSVLTPRTASLGPVGLLLSVLSLHSFVC